ncbi:MAG: MAPEG family protein [Sedimentitalea sp.]
MTTELTYLVLTMMLAASLWIPYIVGVNKHPQDGVDPFERPAPLSDFPAWVHRAHRAHLNLLEGALPFGALILIAHMLEVSTFVTVWGAALFFWLRLAHAVGFIAGWARLPLRPILFTASWAVTMAIGVQLLIA